MIQIESITIKEFRGIRDLTLQFGGKNFAICGPNGTGKSGVVDAIEFALTGNVSRLSGEGRGDISVKTHGPHVDSRNAPDKARVILTARIPSLSKTVTIERTVKAPTKPQVTPIDADVAALLELVQSHPEVVLSRRELIKYVLATPGDRAKEVQELLRLDQVEQVRTGLQKLANACERELKTLTADVTASRDRILQATGLSALSRESLLEAANTRRASLALVALSELTDATSLKDGLATAGTGQVHRIPKAQALADIKTTREVLSELAGSPSIAAISDVQTDLRTLAADHSLASGITLENFYSTGLKLATAEACPFCDTAWNLAALKHLVQGKLDHLKEVAQRRKAVESKLVPLARLLGRARASTEALMRHAGNAIPLVDSQALKDQAAKWLESINVFSRFLPISDTVAALATLASVPKTVSDSIDELEEHVLGLPEPSKQDAARDWLIVAEERLDQYRATKRKHQSANERATRSRQVFDLYVKTSDGVLSGVYERVQADFAALYAFINRDDEDKFAAKLVPSMGKLGFDVDFYGRGYFPPGAYHSEGHQDGMGLCLYLALMRHLQGAGFKLAVLDDVLMSVDAGHRREVCALLQKEFPTTQFVMTTHDPIWLRYMKTERVIGARAFAQFRRWSVDHGPTEWDDRDVWTEIDDYLSKNDVRSAAALLRHYLEYASSEICHRLRVPVEFRGDAQHQLGELLPPAIACLRKIYSDAKQSANSWNLKDRLVEIANLEASFSELAKRSQAEQWQVNVTVHFNDWENLGAKEFEPVVRAHRELLAGFECPHCRGLLRITPDRETREFLSCDCGVTNFSLRVKPKAPKAPVGNA